MFNSSIDAFLLSLQLLMTFSIRFRLYVEYFSLSKIEQQTKVLKKESFEAIFFLTRKKKLKLLEIALNFDAFLSLNFVSRTHEGIANCEIE